MIERKKLFNSSLNNVSKKRLAEIQARTYKPKRSALKPMSKKMKSRVSDWRKTAKEICTVNGVLRCALCGYAITGEWHAHHYRERRGVAHSIENDKYVCALHPGCHLGIDHNSADAYNFARDRIEQNLNLWRK